MKKFAADYSIFILIAIFAGAYIFVSLVRHIHFGSFAFDLGIFDQTIWNYSRFQAPFSTLKNMNILGDHFSPSLALFALLFWLWDDVKILLIAQSLVIISGAYPVYLLARKITKDRIVALIIAFSYLSFAGLQNAVVFDFHEITVATGFLAWIFYVIYEKKWIHYWFLILIILGFKEDMSLLVTTLGLYLIVTRNNFKIGTFTILVGLTWFFIATKILIPHFATDAAFSYMPQIPQNPFEFFQAMTYPPIKIQTMFWTFAPFAFLPLLHPAILILVIPQFIGRFLDNVYLTHWGLGMHYSAPLSIILAVGTIFSLERFKHKTRIICAFIIIVTTLVTQVTLHLPLNTLFKSDFYQTKPWMQDNYKVISRVPRNASLATQNNLGSHLSHREKIYLLPTVSDAEYIMVDFHPGQPANNFWPGTREDIYKQIAILIENKKYMIEYQEDQTMLLRRLHN